MTKVELVLEKLRAHGYTPKRSGGGWVSRCPAHNDKQPSLSISEGGGGTPLLNCFAGCGYLQILASLGIEPGVVAPDSGERPPAPRPPRPPQPPSSGTPRAFPTADAAVKNLEATLGGRTGYYTYHESGGEPVGVVVRWDRPGGSKTLRPVARLGGGWRVGAIPDPRPLYRLPDLPGADTVFVVEGEKCADALAELGLTPTTSSGGSKAAKKTDWRPLAGKAVAILPDNDKPGGKYRDDVIKELGDLDPQPAVRIVELPDISPGGDVVDVIDSRRQAGRDDDAIRAEILKLVDDAPVVDFETRLDTPDPDAPAPVIVTMADVDPREVEWLWPDRFPLGAVSLLCGKPGEGKSFLTLDVAARISTGSPWPDGTACPSGDVLLMTSEDDPAATIRPRLDSHYADARRVHLLNVMKYRDSGGSERESLLSLEDHDVIETALQRLPRTKLVIIDPIGSFIGAKTDSYRDNEVRGQLAPIAKLAERYGVAVVVVAHRRKSGASSADDTVMGSRAFSGLARAVWHLQRDPQDQTRRLLLGGKTNLSGEVDGLAFSIGGAPPSIRWERDPVKLRADDIVGFESGGGAGDHSAVGDAVDLLREELHHGPVPSGDIFALAKKEGVTRATLRRASQRLGIVKTKAGFDGAWTWALKAAPQGGGGDGDSGEEVVV